MILIILLPPLSACLCDSYYANDWNYSNEIFQFKCNKVTIIRRLTSLVIHLRQLVHSLDWKIAFLLIR